MVWDVNMIVFECVQMFACTHVCVCIYVCVRVFVGMYVCAYVCVCVCVCVNNLCEHDFALYIYVFKMMITI